MSWGAFELAGEASEVEDLIDQVRALRQELRDLQNEFLASLAVPSVPPDTCAL